MIEINNQTKIKISKKDLKNFFHKLLRKLEIEKDLSLVFVGEKRIKKLNQIYLKKNKITDVLSFAGDDKNLGEIVICLTQAKKQAKEQKHSLDKELKILIIHGLLHLLGFDHQTKKEREKMEKMENQLLKISI